MTDDSATLRATIEQVARTWAKTPDDYYELAAAIEHIVLASQSSWAKEKAELERQLAEADAVIDQCSTPPYHDPALYRWWNNALDRHASRPVTVKE